MAMLGGFLPYRTFARKFKIHLRLIHEFGTFFYAIPEMLV